MHPIAFEIVLGLIIVVVAMTQVIIPAVKGLPLFPLLKFRDSRKALAGAEEEIVEATIRDEVVSKRAQAEKIRQRPVGEE